MYDYARVEAYLDSFANYEVLPGFGFAGGGYDLSHVHELLCRLGDPQWGPLTVHVAGSKGKGSVAAMVASVLSTCGVRTALYTSPHMVHLGERIQVDGAPATARQMSEALGLVKPHVEAMLAEGRWRRHTYFEILTALAFVHFRMCGVEAQVIEVGLGGRLDATNVVEADVCVITPISLEHTAVLGDTVQKIASEKAGIIKPGATIVTAPQEYSALEVIRQKCSSVGVPLLEVGRDVTFAVEEHDLYGQRVSVDGRFGWRQFRIPLAGGYQAENAATAFAALKSLPDGGLAVGDDCLERGFVSVCWPGRFEVLAERPLLILDGAHNPASMRRFADSLDVLNVPRPLVFVVGFSGDGQELGKDDCPVAVEPSHAGNRLTGIERDPKCESGRRSDVRQSEDPLEHRKIIRRKCGECEQDQANGGDPSMKRTEIHGFPPRDWMLSLYSVCERRSFDAGVIRWRILDNALLRSTDMDRTAIQLVIHLALKAEVEFERRVAIQTGDR